MGIKGLFQYLNEPLTRSHISSFAGCVAAIDMSGLIYKGMSGPPVPMMQKVIPYIADRMDMLLRYNIQPICVFDGETPPAKKETVAKRNEQRRLSGLPLRNSPESRMLINGIQNAMTVRNIPCIHAPYEADGQIAFLEKNDFVHLVISEDSDFVALGCRKIMFKMNQQGFGDVYDFKDIHRVFNEQIQHFNFDRFVTRCILMGADYLPNIPGIGPIKIKQLFENTETSNIDDIIAAIPKVLNKDFTIPPNYAQKFRQAKFALQHQVIYDTCRQERAYLSPIQEPFSKEELILLVGDLKEGEKEANLLLALGNTPIKEAAKLKKSGKKFRTNYELNRHLVGHFGENPYKCYFCKTSYSTYLVNHYRLHTEEKPYRCLLCKKQFKEKSVLMTHTKYHDGIKRHECPFPTCNWAFVLRGQVTQHFHAHTGEKLFNCETCGLYLRTKNSLNIHQMRRHSKSVREKPYVCQVCGNCFYDKYNLKMHTRIHTGEKPFKCTYEGCTYAFTRNIDLQSHMYTHSKSRKKPYVCDVCGDSFYTQFNLKRHRITHTGEKPFKCTIEGCDKSFTRHAVLQAHILVHSGEKPYKCKIPGCDKEFREKRLLKVHLDKHNGKRWTCTICSENFSTQYYLDTHRKIHKDTT